MRVLFRRARNKYKEGDIIPKITLSLFGYHCKKCMRWHYSNSKIGRAHQPNIEDKA